MPDNRYYYFKDAKGNRHTVNKAAFDNDREGFAKAFPGARMEVIDRKTGRRGDVDVKDAGRVGDFGAHLFTGQTVRREKYQPKTSLGKAAQSVAQEKWGGEGGKESELVKGLREADALRKRDEEQMPIDYTNPGAVKQMVGRTHREQQTLERRMEQAGREAGKDVMKPLREKEARLKTPIVDTGDANINNNIINTQEQAERQLAESGLEFANKHLDDYVSSNILNEFKTATAEGAAAESALSKVSPFAYMAAGKAYNEALDPDKLLKHLQEKANADIASLLSNPKMQAEIGLKAAAYGISPEEYVEKSLIPGMQAKLASDFDKSELSRNMPKSTAEYIIRGVNDSMIGTILSMSMMSKKQRQYAQQGMAMTDNGENPDVNPGMAARVARGTLGFVADAPVFGAAGKAGAAVAGKVFGNGVTQTARIANSTLGGRIARMAGSGMVSQGVTGVLYGSTNAAVQNYSTGDDTSIGNTVKLMAMGGLSEGASWATMGGIGGVVGAGIYNVSGVKRIPAKAFQLAMEGIGMHMGGNVAKTIEGHDTDWLSVEGNLEACANVIALKLTHARLPKRQEKDGVKESYLDVVARNIKSLMTSDGQRAAFGGYTFTDEEKEQLFGSASAPKRKESLYGYDVHDNPLTRKESLTSWAMRTKKTAANGKGEKDTDAEFVKTAYDEIMADNSIPWDTKAKFSALVMGTVPSERPMMENCRIEGDSVNEYSKNGELLSKNSFKSIDERNSIIYSLNLKREDQRLSNAYGAAQIKDEKTAQATLEDVAEANGMTAEQLKTAMDKQPLRRSEEEQNACVALRKAYEDEQFMPGTLHAEQSNTEGKDVVEENGLGTETPNNEAVAEVLGDLGKAEDALQAAMDGNDVLKEEFERMQKAGMSNPQIYMELFNSGLTQEQLAPLADYINALSKAQGMFKGTQDKIVETTQKHVGQWSYKDELNGEKQNGEQMLFVKDNKGRVLIVGAGDVTFDGEGRVRDGDMLSVYDPATREMDFVHAKDVTLEHTATSEEYAKDYQRQLEELNSGAYAAAQQEQIEKGKVKSEESEGEPEGDNKPHEASLSPTEPLGEGASAPIGEEPLPENKVETEKKPVATFADGTPVPMKKDSKGRETADYSQMSAEQGAVWMSSQFGENAEAAVDGQIKRAEKMLKDAEKIKVDYTGDLNDAKEAEAQKTMAVDTAKKELELYTNIKKVMTENKVKAGMEKVSSVGGVGEVGSVGSVGVAREKFESGLRVVGNKRTRTLADGTKLKGHYEIVEADSLTPSHNANDGYKKSDGFPVNEEGRTINDRDYENDKQAQLVTDMIAMKYDGQAVDQVPVVTSDGIVVDGNGRTMAGQKAAKNGTDGAYLEALKENAENYGFTAEQIEQSGIKHPRLVLVSDEPMKYDTATFAKFNKNEKKSQGNTQQAVANSKKLSTDEIGTIISEIEGSGSLDAFFNNPSAINSLLIRLVDKGVIGLNEVAGLREGENKLSASGKDFVKNLLLGSVFSENTIRMMGADAMLKTKALNGIRAVTDNMKLGDYALMKEIDQAVQLLYEARQGGSGVDAYLRTPAMFGENAADRFDPISQAIALALEGKVEDFRELMMAYNRNAAPYADASQTEMFGERPTKEDFVNEFLKLRNWEDYETRHSSKEGNGDAGSSEGTEPQARGGSEPTEGEGLGSRGDTEQGENINAIPSKKDSGTHVKNTEGESGNIGLGSTGKGTRNAEGQREVDKTQRTNTTRDPLVETTKAAFEQSKAEYLKALKEGKTGMELENAELHYKFSFLDYQNVMGVTDAESLEKLWKREFESAKTSETEPSEASLGLPKPLGEKGAAEPVDEGASAQDGEEPSKTNPLAWLAHTAEMFKDEQVQKAKDGLVKAKESGDAEEIKRATADMKQAMETKLRGNGIGLVERRRIIGREIGKILGEEAGKAEAEKINKPWEQMDLEEREAVSSKNPLTETEINELTSEENRELIPAALAYLRGDKGNIINAISYFKIWNDVRSRHENVPDNSGAKDGTQLDAPDTGGSQELGLGRGREGGGADGPVDRTDGERTTPGERESGTSGENNSSVPTGKPSNDKGEGNTPGTDAVSAGSTDTRGGSRLGNEGNVPKRGGQGGGNRPLDPNAGRKPTAKQGTHFPDSTSERLKQERAEYEQKKKDFWERWKKAGQGYMKISLTPFKALNLSPEQIEMLPELFKMHLNGAVLKIKEGIYKFNEWKAAMRAEEGEELKMIGLSDDDIDRFIEDYWNTPYQMDGETHTIGEWAGIHGNEKLRNKLSEPLNDKYQRQVDAEPIKVKIGDKKNIEETLPYLLPQQQEDVLRAETQFFGKGHADREHAYGKGYMFTNGTGTGKTFTGLGVAKRLVKQGKGRILIVTPSQTKVSDWIKDGRNLNMEIRDLDSWAKERGTTATTESGEGVVITTFANFGLNKKLLETKWDAVIYDESHRIMENKKGTETARSMQHYMVTNRDENHCFLRLQETNKDYQKMKDLGERFDAERDKEVKRIQDEYKASHPSATPRDVAYATSRMLPKERNGFTPGDYASFPKLGKIHAEFMKALSHYTNEVKPKLEAQAKNEWKDTKTIFLSATPFNTRENLDYAEGYIFKYPETDERGMSGRTQFYLNHFGAAYKYRYHRLEQSTSNPEAVAKQEIEFSDYLQHTLGTMSGRIIDSPYDYSRDFPTASPDHAEEFNQAVQDAVRGHGVLAQAYGQTIGDYNYGSALFETMKVANIIERIKAHLGAGRKVVIFHRRVETKEPLKPPFVSMLEQANHLISLMSAGEKKTEAIQAVRAFRRKYADLLEWEQTLDYSMPREQIAKVFGKDNVLFFSGKESKKVKDKAVDTFNSDDSGKNIIVIQEASGKEGISLHDTTGKHQRVCITLALPQSPITALQIEGRTYRIGNKSNAIFEYPILGLNSEMMLFGQKFNNQVSTTENLALGSQARSLRDSFANGILEHSGVVPIDQQGVGGKEFDAPKDQSTDGFDNAVLDYYSNQKLNSRNREGVDYFPTPEPLGYKMMEWANMGEGDTVLEPSAGHGAIARYAPKGNQMVAIEPSQSLFTKLQLKAGGLGRKFQNTIFENYDISNKHDVVVMNPPFGTAGATAIAHLGKAFKHLEEGGRVVALIPRGSTDKKFEKWIEGEKTAVMRAEVALPDIVFKQAGTNVVCRVVVVDKISNKAMRAKAGSVEKWDLGGHYDKIEDFFEGLRDVEMPDRIIDTNAIMMKKSKQTVKDLKELKDARVDFNEGGINVRVRGDWKDYSIPFDMDGYSAEQKKKYLASTYETFEQQERQTRNETSQAVLDELKKLTCKLADMTEDEMQRYLKKQSEGKGVMYRIEHAAEVYNKANQHYRTEDALDEVNTKFNERLDSLMENPNQKKQELSLGYPGEFLSDAGLGNSEIIVEYSKIVRKSSDTYRNAHPFDISDIKDLPKAINSPIAVFDNTSGNNAGKVILTELKKGDNNFIAVVRATERNRKGGVVLEVNEIRTLFPKESRGIVNWFNTGKTCNVNKEKALTWIEALRTHRGTELTEQELISASNVIKDFDISKQKNINYRIGDNKIENTNSINEITNNRITKAIDKAVEQTGGKVKMVNTVEEIGNEQVRRDIENGKQVTGWYDENTGEMHLYMPNIHDAYTAEKTVWHETVGHKGMRGLLGDKFNDYMRGLWMDLDNPVNAELRAYVKERMGKDSMGFYDAIEEFIAESAEKGKGEPGFWNNIKNKVTDALHEIGYRISPNVKDVKYMLWLAKNVQKNGDDPWWKMRADAVKWKIEHENVEYTKIHGGEFYENDGKSHDFEDMSREEWDEATDGQIHYRTAPSAATALDRYHTMLNAHGYMATEAFMDNMLSLDKLMRAVDPSIKKIEDVKSSMNPYVLQNTMQGAMSDKMTLFEHQVMKPLDKAMSDVLDSFAGKNTEEKIRECNLYMICKHGLERNRVLFVRDKISEKRKEKSEESNSIDALEASWNGERNILGQKLRSGQIDLREYYRQMDEWIVQNLDKDFKAEEHDYSGMHGLQEIDDLKSPYDDAGAIDSVMNQEAKMESLKKGSVDNLWKRIKDATDYSINSDYENGLMSEELQDRVKNMFDWYVPLRKYDEATAEDIYGYISGDNGKGFIGETLMNAKGRKSLSDVNVLAQIGAMGNRAIRNGGQNAVKQAFARFVRNSGEQNLVKETKVWVEKTGTDANGNDIWEEAYPQIPENANAHDIATIVDAFETDMKTKQAKGEAKTLSNSTDIGFKFARAKNKSEHFVDVKIAGRTHRFVVLGNPRAAQALNGMLENSSPKSALLKGLKSTTRFMAQMATSYSPEFVMRNIIRDAEFASSNVTAKEGVMYGLKWARYYAELNPLNVAFNEGAGALKSLKWKDLKEGVGMGLYARYREGTLGDSKMERYFKEFMQNGGETGWVQVKTMQEWEKDYKRDVSRERSKVAKTGKTLRDFLVGNVENLNEMTENMARFATFCTSRDLGRSAVRSAYDAKQVSTNFNRHGSGDAIKTFKNGEMGTSKEMRRNVYGTIASYLKNYSMFFNAGVQSTNLLVNNVKKAPVGTVASMMAMPFGLGILAALANNAMIANEDEKKRKGVKDPYGELPEYIRRNNLCIYKGGGEFVTIPLAIELRAFYGLGDIVAGMTVAKNVKSTRNAAMDAVGCMSQLLPVVDFMNTSAFDKEPGKETLKGVLPTAAAPFVEWWLNSDWKGVPIRREGDYTENRPAWMNAYSGTPEKLMDLNKWVNAKTNDVAPGNENMRGNSLLDEATDPAMLNHIIGTLGGGAATFITRGTGLVLKYSDGREQEIETKDIPFLRSLLYTPSEQTSMARTKAKWYGYKESMEKSTSNYSLLKNKNVPLTERIRNAADRHRFEQSADYARIRIIKDAEKQMKRWNKMKRLNADDKKQVDFANKNIEMIMQKAVEQMDKVNDY